MRLLFVCKRHPQQRDLIDRPYGRFYYLPTLLAGMGHDVRVVLCSHTNVPAHECERNGVYWSSHDLRSLGPRKLAAWALSDAIVFQPDWIVGLSDTWYGWLSHHIARRTGARLAVDAYDNYESYMPWNLPLHYFWRRAIAAADVVTAAGPQLAALLDRHRSKQMPAAIIPMAADPIFIPFERNTARTRMELPLEAPLIGYFGSWAGNRSTDILLEVFRIVREQNPAARFVLSGRPPAHALSEPGVLALGYIDDELLPIALSALDVACVITANTSFGRYSYPAKLCEAMACNVPVVATATEPVRWMLRDDARFLVSIGDARKIAERILDLLGRGRIVYPVQQTWADSARLFDKALRDASAV